MECTVCVPVGSSSSTTIFEAAGRGAKDDSRGSVARRAERETGGIGWENKRGAQGSPRSAHAVG
jgi:hypothetical protein